MIGKFFSYILFSEKFDRYYVGHTSDVQKRLERHNKGMVPSTKFYLPWKIVYTREFNSKAEAAARELQIKKKKSRQYIQALINNTEL